MANERQVVLNIVRICGKQDFRNNHHAEQALEELKHDEDLLDSVFGERFLYRLLAISKGEKTKGDCILCGAKPTYNGAVCAKCLEKVGEIAEKEKQGTPVKEAPEQVSSVKISSPKISSPKVEKQSVKANKFDSKDFISEIVKNVDSSMDRLANQKTVQKTYSLVYVTLILTIMNLISILGLGAYILFFLGK